MSNWFENNATKSVISYTLIIVTATWAVSTFILEDSKLSDVKSQLETQKIITDQYKVKVDILQKDIEKLQAENTEYKSWLEKEGKVVPSIFVAKNLQMQEEIKNLKSVIKNNSIEQDANQRLNIGTAYINNELDISLTLDEVSIGNKATIYIKLPNTTKNIKYDDIRAGYIIPFEKDNKKYKITFTKVLFVSDVVEFTIDSSN
ncbi:hypothetical protein ABTC25_09040 [Acinetobacter baumannii]|uniref:hypothetical protein n=1 Tax=Acinetobacter calcoaceticus/baumannii complex TaxID=909768 RepID=UPI00094C1A28|nr:MULTISPECIES: hypothetical protein [Acinetobacter calcoaceticus/baumannii complex]MDV7665124.1 hypothetical protein [Acinetobacter baumannii]PNC64896.1 hypothetical protein CK480_01645 [Acinetobacter baumannii]HEO1797631.1 hypothetical protein [Acinetobacter baumannii]